MKKLAIALAVIFATQNIYAQADSTTKPLPAPPPKLNLTNRANDHFLLQFGFDGWANRPDSVRTTGFGKHFNIYFMLDKPFKNSPNFSVAYGLGIGSSNIYFNNTYVDLKSTSARLPFRPFVTGTDSANFDKFKLTTIFVEVPVELRWVSNPAQPDKGFKAAIGVKVGQILKAYTKGKNLENKNGNSVYGNKYIEKEQERKFINGTRIAFTARFGIGNFTLHGAYQINNFLKNNAGGEFRPYSIGLSIGGL
jgi:hypothetical protein